MLWFLLWLCDSIAILVLRAFLGVLFSNFGKYRVYMYLPPPPLCNLQQQQNNDKEKMTSKIEALFLWKLSKNCLKFAPFKIIFILWKHHQTGDCNLVCQQVLFFRQSHLILYFSLSINLMFLIRFANLFEPGWDNLIVPYLFFNTSSVN